jgi:Prokaryotic Cytochrome C oxidase subunit IV
LNPGPPTGTWSPALDRHLRTVTCAWIILSANTIGSCWLAPGHARGAAVVASAPITVAVIPLGFIKGHMIIRYFMEVRTAVAQAISPPGGSTFCGPESSRSIHTKES